MVKALWDKQLAEELWEGRTYFRGDTRLRLAGVQTVIYQYLL